MKEAGDREVQLRLCASSSIGMMYFRTVMLKPHVLQVFLSQGRDDSAASFSDQWHVRLLMDILGNT